MACLVTNMAVEIDQPSITAISFSSSATSSSSTLTPEESTDDSRMARALQLLLSEEDPITCSRGGTLETMRSARKAASSEDILLSANKRALRMHASDYWRATSSMDALNCCVDDVVTHPRGKSATVFAATQLWRSIVLNLEQRLRSRPHRRLFFRRMLFLQPQYSGTDVVDCLHDYLISTAGRHALVSREQACVICSKLLESGAIENAKDSSCVTFVETACYRFTGHHPWKGARSKKVSLQAASGSLDILSQTHPIPQKKSSPSMMSVARLASFCKLPWMKQKKPQLAASPHPSREFLTSSSQPQSFPPQPSNQSLPFSGTKYNRHHLYVTEEKYRLPEEHRYSRGSQRIVRSNSFTSVVSTTDDGTKWVLYGYV